MIRSEVGFLQSEPSRLATASVFAALDGAVIFWH